MSLTFPLVTFLSLFLYCADLSNITFSEFRYSNTSEVKTELACNIKLRQSLLNRTPLAEFEIKTRAVSYVTLNERTYKKDIWPFIPNKYTCAVLGLQSHDPNDSDDY